MKKLRLKYENSEGKEIIGIVCQKPDYWLALQINTHLRIKLQRKEDIRVYQDALSTNVYFHFFMDEEDDRQKYYLIKNQSAVSSLFQRLKKSDYFLILEGFRSSGQISKILNKIPGIDAAIRFPLTNIPKIEYFLEDMELHLMEIKRRLIKK